MGVQFPVAGLSNRSLIYPCLERCPRKKAGVPKFVILKL